MNDIEERMTHEEMIEQLENSILLIKQNGKDWLDERDIPILKEAIKAMEIEPCKDCTSKQAVKEQMIKYGFLAPDMTVTEFVEDCLPSIQPMQKTGKWIKKIVRGSLELYCSRCGDGIDVIYEYNYCPTCGAKMEESEDK